MTTELILATLITILAIFFLAKVVLRSMKTKQATMKVQDLQEEFCKDQIETKVPEAEEKKPEPMYQLQTHKIKYHVYSMSKLQDYGCKDLYSTFVLDGLWMNEPFHTTFYKILLLLDKNDLMIIDPNSEVLILNIRDRHTNKMIISKSYKVFSTKDIINATLIEVMKSILRFQKYDAQNILLAICAIALQDSIHYIFKDEFKNTIEDLFKDYKYEDVVRAMIDLIKEKNEKLLFVDNAFKEAFLSTQSEPYNDSVEPLLSQLPSKLPQKILQHI